MGYEKTMIHPCQSGLKIPLTQEGIGKPPQQAITKIKIN
jgi:hypothetical protein